MNLAFVGDLANQNKGVKYLLVGVEIFSRFVSIQTMKTKYAKEILPAFKKISFQIKNPAKLGVEK